MTVQVIPQDEGALHQQLQLHQVSQPVEAQQVLLWFSAEKSYPECPELRKQHRDPSTEASTGAVLLDVKVLKCRDFRCDGVHVFQSYGHTQRQPGHAGGDGGRVGGERVPTDDGECLQLLEGTQPGGEAALDALSDVPVADS